METLQAVLLWAAIFRRNRPTLVEPYAFLLGEAEFDPVFERTRARGLPYRADPGHRRLNQINHGDGGRGLY